MNPNSLLRIRDLSKDELMGILMDAQLFGASQKDWQLPQRRLVANLFFEPSTGHTIPLRLRSISWAAAWKISPLPEAAWKRERAFTTRSRHLRAWAMTRWSSVIARMSISGSWRASRSRSSMRETAPGTIRHSVCSIC